MASQRTKRTPKGRRDWKPDWILAFAQTGTVSAACEAVNVGRTTVYQARSDEAFAEAWDEVEAKTTDIMEREAFRRAVEGTERAIYHQGQVCGFERQFSDTLLIFMLKARKPDVYRENSRLEISGPNGDAIRLEPPEDENTRSTRAARLLKDAGLVELASNGRSNGSH